MISTSVKTWLFDENCTPNAAYFSRPPKSGTLIKDACFTRHLPFVRDARSGTVPGYSHSPLAGLKLEFFRTYRQDYAFRQGRVPSLRSG